MDVAEPPRIVFDAPAQCSDAERAEELLRRTLGSVRSATPGWTVGLHVERTAPHAIRAEGDIRDERGTRIAHRVLYATGPDCAALARGVGLWASLVLEAESKRPHVAGDEPQGGEAAPPPKGPPVEPGGDTTELPDPGTSFGAAASEPPTPTPPAEKLSTEPDWYLRHEPSARTIEVGASGFLMTGAGIGAMAGPSPYAILETGHGVFLRPSIAFAASLPSFPSERGHGSWLGTRLDACLRVPGLYSTRAGLQLDLCGGSDLGVTFADEGSASTVFPFAALGPSLDLRGELGGNLAVTLRGVVGLNVLRPPNTDEAWSGRIELALSWGLR